MADKERLDYICDSCGAQEMTRQKWASGMVRVVCEKCGDAHTELEKPE